MKRDIVSKRARHIKYEIRDIVEIARHLQSLGTNVTWENIGDPVQKGEPIPGWIKEIVKSLSLRDSSYCYSDSMGERSVREFLADTVNGRGGAKVRPSDFIFFNGLGDAIGKLFGFLDPGSRILGPSPGYSALSSVEAAHSGSPHLTYGRDQANGWMPDPESIEFALESNDSIVAVAVINPDNPTGAVYPRDALSDIVRIAARHGCFVICDETYSRITYNGAKMTHLSDVIGDAPGIALRSISKEYPWPGARCGWIEVYNRSSNAEFGRYVDSLAALKRLEVCSTTLPQLTIPDVWGDPRYAEHCAERNRTFEKRSREAFDALGNVGGTRLTIPQGAFYATVTFDEAALDCSQTLHIGDPAADAYIRCKAEGVAKDKRFVYYLLAATGICVVPLSGFCSELPGFRMTLLETDEAKRLWIFSTIREAIRLYLSSG